MYLLDGTEPDWDKLLEYNRDDVFALKAVVDNLRELSAATEGRASAVLALLQPMGSYKSNIVDRGRVYKSSTT